MLHYLGIKELFTSSPRNIKRRLFRDIITILLCTSSLIIAIGIIQGSRTKNQISARVITDSTRIVRERFQDIFRPTLHDLGLIARWAQVGAIDFAAPEKITALLSPILLLRPEIGEITLVNNNGGQIILFQKNSEIQTIISDGKDAPVEKPDWHNGAINQPPDKPVYWTDLYVHPILKEKTITGAIAWSDTHGTAQGVAAISITVGAVLNMVDEITLPSNLGIMIFNSSGLSFSTYDSAKETHSPVSVERNSKTYSKAGNLAIKRWNELHIQEEAFIDFRVDKSRWWVGFIPLSNELEANWLAILVPESHITKDVQNRWFQLILMSFAILVTGVLLASLLVRKYSSQLRDLPIKTIEQESFSADIKKLINAGESANVEFKSTIRKNLQSGKVGKEIELAWLKSVSGFMNSDGGIILLGVTDSGDIHGIEDDDFANHDKCLLHCKNLISTHIGAEFTRYIHVKIGIISEKAIVVVECEPVRKPVFLRVGKNEDFYIRSGPASIKLTMSQMVKYLSDR
ncbi:RNA-binding domain-containing protein [Desulfosediminicola flagellatus]|uniref:RNA-binding domain-containing protein n=1 Tax=Desulfosediminicola flagellatus TaxID=2569541 RepID=UPI0010ABBB11|nr:RNA-binding domain-containing protein [Desulfosediminicola flagellatus]